MGTSEKLNRDFIAFRDECIELRVLVNTHETLFEGGREQDNLLNSVARSFFYDLNGWLLELYILRVCKLTDPAVSRGKENITTQAIMRRLEELLTLSAQELAKIRSVYDRLQVYRKLMEDARNKRVAHFDQAVSRSNVTLGAHKREEFSAFLVDLQEFCDEVGRVVGAGPLDFRCSAADVDALSLVSYLAKCRRGQSE